MAKWQLHEAKARLNELIRCAATEGPQTITRRGKDVAVVLSPDEYRRLTGAKMDFVEFLLSGPKWGDDVVDLINQRSKDTGRKIVLS